MKKLVIEKTVYQFNELSDEAKEKARDWWRQGYEFQWDEVTASMEAHAKALGVKLGHWELDVEAYRMNIPFEMTQSDGVLALTGLRLRTWLINNVWTHLERGKYFSTSGSTDPDGHYHYKFRHSKTTHEVLCPFTGVCYDETLLDSIRKFIAKPNETDTLRDLVRKAFEDLAHNIQSEYEGAMENDEVDESIRANEYEFMEDGRIA